MNTTYHKFLIVSAVILLVGGVYVYFSHELDVQAATPTTSALMSSSGNPFPLAGLGSTASANDQISQDTAFLATLTSLTKIKIDTSLFKDSAFNALNDNTVILEPGAPGRPNPFAPINASVPITTASVSPVITNPVSQITEKTAVLNGAIASDTPGVTSTYFEYGPTPTFGKATPPVKQSLIGSFVTSVSGLASGTMYFFRAAAKINGTLHFGETISFTTN